MDMRAHTEVTLTLGAAATEILSVLYAMTALLDAQMATVRKMALVGPTKKAQEEVLECIGADTHRWPEVRGHMINAIPHAVELFCKKMWFTLWDYTKLLVAGRCH